MMPFLDSREVDVLCPCLRHAGSAHLCSALTMTKPVMSQSSPRLLLRPAWSFSQTIFKISNLCE